MSGIEAYRTDRNMTALCMMHECWDDFEMNVQYLQNMEE